MKLIPTWFRIPKRMMGETYAVRISPDNFAAVVQPFNSRHVAYWTSGAVPDDMMEEVLGWRDGCLNDLARQCGNKSK
jgi:hypothetical protein